MTENDRKLNYEKPEMNSEDVKGVIKRIDQDRCMDPNVPNASGYMGSRSPLFPQGRRARWLIALVLVLFLLAFLAAFLN